MSSPPAADRLARHCLALAFWLPLTVCTYLALTPSPPEPVLRFSDVVLHAAAFTYLTFALGLAYPGLRLSSVLWWMLGYGLVLEVVQSFEPTRSAEIKDLLVDGAAILAGLGLLRGAGAASRRLVRTVLGLLLPAGR